MRNGYAGCTRCWEVGTGLRWTFLSQEGRVWCLTTAVHSLGIGGGLPGVLQGSN